MANLISILPKLIYVLLINEQIRAQMMNMWNHTNVAVSCGSHFTGHYGVE